MSSFIILDKDFRISDLGLEKARYLVVLPESKKGVRFSLQHGAFILIRSPRLCKRLSEYLGVEVKPLSSANVPPLSAAEHGDSITLVSPVADGFKFVDLLIKDCV